MLLLEGFGGALLTEGFIPEGAVIPPANGAGATQSLLLEGFGGALLTEGFLGGGDAVIVVPPPILGIKHAGRAFIELVQGLVGYGNRDFTLSSSYRRGSVVMFLNGIALIKTSLEGWEELGSNRIRMNRAPEVGDTIHAFFRPL